MKIKYCLRTVEEKKSKILRHKVAKIRAKIAMSKAKYKVYGNLHLLGPKKEEKGIYKLVKF